MPPVKSSLPGSGFPLQIGNGLAGEQRGQALTKYSIVVNTWLHKLERCKVVKLFQEWVAGLGKNLHM